MKRQLVLWVLLAAIGQAASAGPAVSDEPAKVSGFAPAADLAAQVDYYLGRLGESLSDGKDYDEAKQSRVSKDANTLSVLALVLAMHDAEPKYRGGELITAARHLAESSDHYEPAAQALAEVKKAAGGSQAPPPTAVQWGKVASLEALMKQVPIVNNSLKRGLEPNRFKRQADQSAGQSATLAAIAQAVQFDPPADKDAEAVAQWQTLCRQMRDAAGEVNAAIHAGDQQAAQAGMKRLAQNCDACHEKFRDN
jgi:cytochrome c556